MVAAWKSDTFKRSRLAEPLKFLYRKAEITIDGFISAHGSTPTLVCGPHLVPPFASSNPPAPANQSGPSEKSLLKVKEMPRIARFCELARGLRAPDFANCVLESSKVSSLTLKYSRFLETGARDRVRSLLRARVCSATRQILRSALRSPADE